MSNGFKTTDEATYLCAAETTDWQGLQDAIGRVSAGVKAERASLAIDRGGPPTLFYRFQHDPNSRAGKHGQFVVEAQDPVNADAEAIRGYRGPLTVKSYPPTPCAFLVLRGPIAPGGLPWWRVRQAAEAAGRRRTLEEREIYTRFDGADGADNVIELQCLLEPG